MKKILPAVMFITVATSLCCFSQDKKQDYILAAHTSSVIQKNGQSVWIVNTTLTNTTNDTLYYFSSSCSEAQYYSIDTSALFVRLPDCDKNVQTVLEVFPKSSRTVYIEVVAYQPLKNSVTYRILLMMYKAKNKLDRTPIDDFKKSRLVWSNELKT